MKILCGIACVVVLVQACLGKEDPYSNFFERRENLKAICGKNKWITAEYKRGDRIEVVGYSPVNGKVFILEGMKTDVSKDSMLISSYKNVKVIFSDDIGDTYVSGLFNGESKSTLMTYNTYIRILDNFRNYHFEKTVASAPRKFSILADDPEVYKAAMEMKGARSDLSREFDKRLAPHLGFTYNFAKDGVPTVQWVGEKTLAAYSGLRVADEIVSLKVDFETVRFDLFHEVLENHIFNRIDLFVVRENKTIQVAMFKPSPLEYRLAALPEAD